MKTRETISSCELRALRASTQTGRADASRSAFTLIEVMIVVVLMSVIIIGLTAMFTQTQRAFRAGMNQTDQLEGGRMVTEMLSRELEQIALGYAISNAVNRGVGQTNFYTLIWNQFEQSLPATPSIRANAMSDLFFLSHENQTWTGIGYFLLPDSFTGGAADPLPVATLFRYETNMSNLQFERNPGGMFYGFNQARIGGSVPTVSKILDGIASFNFRASDTNGYWINPAGPVTPIGQIWTHSDFSAKFPQRVDYHFISNAVPAYVEFELGIVEQGVLDHYRSIPLYNVQSNYVAQQAGRVQIFRQRVSVRNVDRSAY